MQKNVFIYLKKKNNWNTGINYQQDRGKTINMIWTCKQDNQKQIAKTTLKITTTKMKEARKTKKNFAARNLECNDGARFNERDMTK